MDRVALILEVIGLPPRELFFETAPSEAQQSEPHLITIERTPGGVYTESHGPDIASLTLRGTFGYEPRVVDGQVRTGFELFKELRDFYREYEEVKGGTRSASFKLQYHNFSEGEHWYAEATDFRTPRDENNRVHYIYELDLKLTAQIKRDFSLTRPGKAEIIGKVGKDLTFAAKTLRGFSGQIQVAKQDISTLLNREVLHPIAELRQAIDEVLAGGSDFVRYPIQKARRVVDSISQIVKDLGNAVLTEQITESLATLYGLRKSVIRLIATPQALDQSIKGATEEFAEELAAWNTIGDDAATEASLSGTHAFARAQAQALVNRSSTGTKQAETWANDTLQRIALRELGDASRWHEIALLNGLDVAPFIDATGGNGKAKWGDTLLVPSSSTRQSQGIAGAFEDSSLIQQKRIEARLYGRDIRLQKRDGKLDIVFLSGGRLATVAGFENLKQAVTSITSINQGELLENPNAGLRQLVGRRMNVGEVELTKWGLEEACTSDPRIASANAIVDADGNATEASLSITPTGASESRDAGSITTQ